MFSAVQDVLEPAGGDDEQGEGGEEEEEGEEQDELNSGDCEVFQCGAASLGHMAYRLLKIIFESPTNCSSGCAGECQV